MYLRRASPADLARIGNDPIAAEAFVFPEEYLDPDPGLVEFDKAWQALNFLLTGAPYAADCPLDIIAGELPAIGGGTIGEPSAWAASPERMAAFNIALQAISDADLAARFDVDAMLVHDVYIADSFVGEDDAVDYVLQGVPALRRFAADCVSAGDGAIRLLA